MSDYMLSVIFLYCAACFALGFIVGRAWYDGADMHADKWRSHHAARRRDILRAGKKQ